MTNSVPVRRALLSVSDKDGLKDLGRKLAERGVELLSTGGTAAELRSAGLSVVDVSDVTGFPEMMDGRVKTLHPKIHGALLALRGDAGHMASMEAHGITPINLLVANLYPFEATVAKGAAPDEVVEYIDIGGPAMIRAAAKNHEYVACVVDVEDYGDLLAELDLNRGATTLEFRRRLALEAFSRTAAYDAAVSGWMAAGLEDAAPRRRVFAGDLSREARYGENPHQRRAAFYSDGGRRPSAATARQWQGKPLSHNNIADADAAFECVADLDPAKPACVIVKHANPCGAAARDTALEAYRAAFDCDRTSAFGGIVAFNRPLDGQTAEAVTEIFTEVVIAPQADDDAKAEFARKKNLRLLTTGAMPDPEAPGLQIKSVSGGFLAQEKDTVRIGAGDLKVVTKRAPTDSELRDLLFAWRVAKHVKSNAIVHAKDGATVGIGAGQMSRVDSCRIAALKARDMAETLGLGDSPAAGSAVASDAFFPFPDGLLAAADSGAAAVIQPGGSMRDDEVVAAADGAGLAMVFTGTRHFRH